VLEKYPGDQTAQLGRSLAMLTSGQYDRAVASFNQIVAKTPNDPFIRVLRARALLSQGKSADAMTDLNFALNVRPGYLNALTLRGIAWSAMREYAKALEDLDAAMVQKETVESLFARAKTYEALGKPDKAAADFRRATELAPVSVFDTLAQAESKRKIREYSKRVPCGGSGQQTGTCL
jgi:tetratricopeptide (TPR) repeat protein